MPGYSGGAAPNPVYGALCDHSEAVRVEFDERTSFAQLLETTFWKTARAHAERPPSDPHYRTAIWCVDARQLETARAFVAAKRARHGRDKVHIDVEPATPFYLAETPHIDLATEGARQMRLLDASRSTPG